MNGLDIILINVISYLGGILSGLYIHHKISKNKDIKKEKINKEKEIIDKYESPIITATPIQQVIPSAPPPLNPSLNKRIIISTE